MIWYSTRVLAKAHFLQYDSKQMYQDPVQIHCIKVENSEYGYTRASHTKHLLNPLKKCVEL